MTRVLFVLVSTLVVIRPSLAAELLEVGTAKQLLVDDHVVSSSAGLTRVLQQPQRICDKPVLVADRSWEGSVLQMPCVLWDEELGVFRMYYWAANGDDIFTCYATSTDGQLWEKPILNLHVGPDGSKANNIVLRGEGQVARVRYVVRNPDPSELERRFLALYIDNIPNLTEFAASSPDGVHWKTEKKIGDLRHVRGGEVTTNPPFFLIEQQWIKDPVDGHRYRAIWRTESQDMMTWTGGRIVAQREEDDDPDLEFYHACSHFQGTRPYHGVHFGYLYLFHPESRRGVRRDGVRLAGTVDTSLMVSRDTINWTRVDRNRRFFPLGPKESWEGKMNYMAPEVIIGDRMLFYYSGWKKEHGAKDNEAGIGLATLPLDRFVSLEPKAKLGSLTTKLLQIVGERLYVNVDAKHGELRVEVLNADGKPMAGYSADSCQSITSDELRAEVKWRGKSLAELKGKSRVQLRFRLANAKLFAFQIQ
jgi:hypothetical protein